ncbi:UNVERIFIED_CONTAM: hypothetical protein Sindi_0950200, partial [Sesamum indicum]
MEPPSDCGHRSAGKCTAVLQYAGNLRQQQQRICSRNSFSGRTAGRGGFSAREKSSKTQNRL